ncbi:MAG: class F sortase [Chloroflexales bacterium]|nr:class F sortase [Chloroflexales bacterium]
MRAWNYARRLGSLVVGTAWLAWLAIGGQVMAAPPPQMAAPACFPETGYCTGGRLYEVWQLGGGLLVFGFPITALQEELIEGRPVQVQWFERARIELHPENLYPYDVLVGRVGADLMGKGAGARAVAATSMPGDCRLFPETGQQVCGEFLSTWLSAGLDLDGDLAVGDLESLALYGLPLTAPRTERLADGKPYVVQWFERARFELHAQPDGTRLVLRGLLGRELAPLAVDPPGTPWVDPYAPPPAPYVPPPPAGLPPQAPARLVIDAIGLDAPTVPVGLNESDEFIVPDHEVGWYMGSASPGQGENIVFWGHILPFLAAPDLPAPFARLSELAPGATVLIVDAAGATHSYAVTQQIRVAPEQIEYVLTQGRELVTLVSCIGEGVYADGGVVDYSERLITIAEPVTAP